MELSFIDVVMDPVELHNNGTRVLFLDGVIVDSQCSNVVTLDWL